MRKTAPLWEWVDLLGSTKPNYISIWNYQKSRLEQIAEGSAPEAVILCEHELVATLGRRAKADNIIDSSVPQIEIERGGDVTLHQPGQLVIYPLLKLHGSIFPGGLHEYLRFCEEVVIQTLSSFRLAAGRWGPTGVWVKVSDGSTRKIASIGVAVRKWITYHGIALNIQNDLQEFSKIRPCDFDSSVMTSMKALGLSVTVDEVAHRFQEIFSKTLEGVSERQLSLLASVENRSLLESAVEC